MGPVALDSTLSDHPRVVSVWFGLLNLNRTLPDSQERWMILVTCNMARSEFIITSILYGRDCAVVLGLPVHLPSAFNAPDSAQLLQPSFAVDKRPRASCPLTAIRNPLVIQYAQWMVGSEPQPRRTQSGMTRGSCARCTRDSEEKIQNRWRRRVLPFNISVYVWFGSTVEIHLTH